MLIMKIRQEDWDERDKYGDDGGIISQGLRADESRHDTRVSPNRTI